MKKVTIILLGLFFTFKGLNAQQQVIFTINQPDSLVADAGNDIHISLGNSWGIGNTPAASGGLLPYSYSWSPGAFLNDSLIANPTVTPLCNMIYILTVFDNNNCSAIDTVFVNTDTTNQISEYLNNDKPSVCYYSENKIVAIYFNHKKYFNENIRISFIDFTGKIIFSNIFQIQNNPLLIKNINKLPDIFIVTISFTDLFWSYKIITK